MTKKTKVWFGPPGVGKSTFVKAVGGLDLEDIKTTEERRKFVTDGYAAFYDDIGAADLQPSDFDPSLFERILVLPPQDKYRERRRVRDITNPAKRRQPDVFHGFERDQRKYDTVLSDFPLKVEG
jgi:ABC-type iron transport system FetAB ATPase subunit